MYKCLVCNQEFHMYFSYREHMHDPELLHERALVRFWPTSDNVQTVLLVIMDVYQRNDWVLLAPLHQINRLLRTRYQHNNYTCFHRVYNFRINIVRMGWSCLNLYFDNNTNKSFFSA